jgi:hypothetical protein
VSGRRPGGRFAPLILLPPVAAGLALAGVAGAAAASSGTVSAEAALPGAGQIDPGDTIAAGLDLAFASVHPTAGVHVDGATASLELSCRPNQAPEARLVIRFRASAYTLAAGDTAWHATADPAAPSGYLGAAAAPDLCGGKKMWTQTVAFAATVSSDVPEDAVQVRFHAVDGGSADCSRQASSACASAWTSPVTVYPAPSPSGQGASQPGSTSGGSGAAGHTVPTPAPGTNRSKAAPAARESTSAAATPGFSREPNVVAEPGGVGAPSGIPAARNGQRLPVVEAAPVVVARSKPLVEVAGLGGLLDGLPVGWFAAAAALDLGLGAALILRHRRRHRVVNRTRT